MTTATDTPALALGTVISGMTVIAAVRQADRPGYLPGLHIVTAANRTTGEFVTWEVARQGNRWVASGGHYFLGWQRERQSDARADALADMIARA